jgi:hypothetical protein
MIWATSIYATWQNSTMAGSQLPNVFCAPLRYSKLYLWPKEVIFMRRENMMRSTLLVKKEQVVFIIISLTSRTIEGIFPSQILKSGTFELQN